MDQIETAAKMALLAGSPVQRAADVIPPEPGQ